MPRKKKKELIEEAELLGIEVPEGATYGAIQKLIDRHTPATAEEMTLGQAMLDHPRCKELRFYFSMKNAQFRGGLSKEDKQAGRELCEELNLPCPKG
jgi:hypothetical protein